MTDFLLYHVTNIENLENILRSGALLCKNQVDAQNLKYRNIAYEEIQERRHQTPVPFPPYGSLHDYIPFHFAPRSPMLYAINKGYVDNYHDGQDRIIYIVVKFSEIANAGLSFVFTDGHPIVAFSEFFNDVNLLSQRIDWDLMEARYWSDTDDDPDRKRRRQAEFLVFQQVPLNLIAGFAVYGRHIKVEVENIAETYKLSALCKVKREWYY